jgi:hypothetical protein
MDTLLEILTVTEVCRAWGKHPDTVMLGMGARKNPLVVRKAPRVWLITAESCRKRWGEPLIPLSTLLDTPE